MLFCTAFRAFGIGCLWAVGVLAGCSSDGTPSTLSPEAALGERAFNEPLLSASGQQSCASCHASASGHSAPNALAVQLGGQHSDVQGLRSSPALRYLAKNTPFHFDAEDTPTGGFFWDGRANTLAEQAAGPLLNPREMANPDKASVVAKIGQTAWASNFQALYGAAVLQNTDVAFDKLLQALERYQREDSEFNAYTSKYDAVLRGQATLTEAEARGLALFNDKDKGNCAACHPSDKGADGSHPLFTDFTYDNLGVPRNRNIAANNDASYFDVGLCARPELAARQDLCGAFKVPSLRNVALRQTFFHNGKFNTLKDALNFYVQRDTHPEKWYPVNADGSVQKFDDIPAQWRANVNTTEAPYGRQPGQTPALNEAEIDDVIAFLKTLSDGWKNK